MKSLLTLLFSLVFISIFAQSNAKSNCLKYVSNAPDGSTAVTITDDFNENILRLESASSFYKYQLLDTKTSEPVFSSTNNSSRGIIDKSKIASGTYYLRLFTRNFIITTKITLSAKRFLLKGNSLAFNE